jgi:hypothetical protein
VKVDPKVAMGFAAPLALAIAIAGIWHTRRQLEQREKSDT